MNSSRGNDPRQLTVVSSGTDKGEETDRTQNVSDSWKERAAEIGQFIRNRANVYFADLANQDVQVRWLGTRKRRTCRIHRYAILAHDHRRLIVKTPVVPGGGRNGPDANPSVQSDRPRVAPVVDPVMAPRYEYEALQAIAKHFEAIADPRFGAVTALDKLPQDRGVVMLEVNQPLLRTLFAWQNRLGRPFRAPNLERPFHDAGAWLREFHKLPPLPHTSERHGSRSEFIRSIHTFAEYLERLLGHAWNFQNVASEIERVAKKRLPEQFPIGAAHGDYVLRNILVEDHKRIAAFDTTASWRAPIFEDIGYFLVGLETSRPQTYGQGYAFSAGLIADCRRAFLDGYFDERGVPLAIITLFEIQSFLDKWSSKLHGCWSSTGFIRAAKRLRLVTINRYYRQYLTRLLSRIDDVK